MKRIVMLEEGEWNRLPKLLADELVRVLRRDALRVVGADGAEITQLLEYITGTLCLGLADVTERIRTN